MCSANKEETVTSRTLTCITAMTLFVALATPSWLSAQHTRYKLIDIDTLGGPAAIGQVDGTGISQFINNPGVVVGGIGLVQLGPSKFFLAVHEQ